LGRPGTNPGNRAPEHVAEATPKARVFRNRQRDDHSVSTDPGGAARAPHRNPAPRGSFGGVVVHETTRGTVAWLHGAIDAAAAPALLRFLVETLDLPLDRIIVDVSGVQELDQHGAAALRTACKAAEARGIDLAFEGAPDGPDPVALGLPHSARVH
jgi:hypothetical protein